jgi:hypothetical protein
LIEMHMENKECPDKSQRAIWALIMIRPLRGLSNVRTAP